MSAGSELVPMLSPEHGVGHEWNHGPTPRHGASIMHPH